MCLYENYKDRKSKGQLLIQCNTISSSKRTIYIHILYFVYFCTVDRIFIIIGLKLWINTVIVINITKMFFCNMYVCQCWLNDEVKKFRISWKRHVHQVQICHMWVFISCYTFRVHEWEMFIQNYRLMINSKLKTSTENSEMCGNCHNDLTRLWIQQICI